MREQKTGVELIKQANDLAKIQKQTVSSPYCQPGEHEFGSSGQCVKCMSHRDPVRYGT